MDEMTVSYLAQEYLVKTFWQRREILQLKWGFLCHCPKCEQEESDARKVGANVAAQAVQESTEARGKKRPLAAVETRSIVVFGAGDERVNGTYIPVATLPPGGVERGVDDLIWKKKGENEWLHIMHAEGFWWIGHFQDAEEDLYVFSSDDPKTPPVGVEGEKIST